MAPGRTVLQMIKDRLAKQGLYDSPGYWDMKAEAYEGLARSNWPSNVYNRYWDERQMAILDRAFGDPRVAPVQPGLPIRVVDVACGTGRACRHLAERGAAVTGLDFAPRTLELAERETRERGLSVDYRRYDALTPPPSDLAGRFDLGVTISCLAMACRDVPSFELALGHLVSLVRPGGHFFFLEPIHSGRLLRRILRMSSAEWIERCEQRGLVLEERGRMGFVPARLLLAFRDWPDACVRPLFRAGERLLDGAPALDPLSDYKWLLFRRASP
ncbi:MAG TPA: class I SAM-dependent methyltransferase [Polyangiaceae bacterium]|nr:class I SAM-dependent methyltransferase [Polyangiaceae bacterium]